MSDVSDMICEAHPDYLWPHDDCPGPGMPHPIITELRGVIYGHEQDRLARLSEAGSPPTPSEAVVVEATLESLRKARPTIPLAPSSSASVLTAAVVEAARQLCEVSDYSIQRKRLLESLATLDRARQESK